MALSVKTSRRQIRISSHKHYLELSADGRNWSKGTGTEETSATYLDLIAFKGKVYAVTSDSYNGSIKVLDEFGSVKSSCGNMGYKIVRFEQAEDGMLLGFDKNDVEYVLKDEGRCTWERYETWKREQEREEEKDRRSKEKKKSVSTSKPRNSSTSTPTRSYSSSSVTAKGKKLGCLGNMFSGVFGCLGTIAVVVFVLWILAKLFSL